MTAFDQAFDIVVGHEGGYTNNPSDPGGETKYGVSKRAYPNVDIANLTLDGAKQIYKTDYWDKLHLDTADPGLALIAFDASVNNGVGAATKWLQSALKVAADGVIGPATQTALQACTADKAQAALVEMHAERINMMANLSTWKTFGKGWSRRLAQLPLQAAGMTSA
jgi:lysozyme family protein